MVHFTSFDTSFGSNGVHAMSCFVFSLLSDVPLRESFVSEIPTYELGDCSIKLLNPRQIFISVPVVYNGDAFDLSDVNKKAMNITTYIADRLREAVNARRMIMMANWILDTGGENER